MQITVFGSTGRVGSRVVRQAVDRGFTVKAVAHEEATFEHSAVTNIVADVLEDDLAEVLEGTDAVISCLGVGNDPLTLLDPPPLYTRGTLNIATKMKEVGLDRLAVISASFVETFERGPLKFRATLPALSLVFKQMEQMEAQLARQSELRWTAVRPGWILEGDASTNAVITQDVIDKDLIRSRTGDIARLLLDAVEQDRWIHQKPAIASPEPKEHTSIAAVAEEIV